MTQNPFWGSWVSRIKCGLGNLKVEATNLIYALSSPLFLLAQKWGCGQSWGLLPLVWVTCCLPNKLTDKPRTTGTLQWFTHSLSTQICETFEGLGMEYPLGKLSSQDQAWLGEDEEFGFPLAQWKSYREVAVGFSLVQLGPQLLCCGRLTQYSMLLGIWSVPERRCLHLLNWGQVLSWSRFRASDWGFFLGSLVVLLDSFCICF